MKAWVWLAVLALAVLHQDFWLWDDASLVFGFLPVGLAYHAAYSLVAAGLWLVVARAAWPAEPEDVTEPVAPDLPA